MKIFTFYTLFILACLTASAQDVIFLNDGTEIKCKVTEIGLNKISYRYPADSSSRSVDILKNEAFMVLLGSGEREIFKNASNFELSSATKPYLTRSGNKIYSDSKMLRSTEISYLLGTDLYSEYSKQKSSIALSNVPIFAGLGVFVFSGLTTIISSYIYNLELSRFQDFYLNGNKWPSLNSYSVDANLRNIETASDFQKVGATLWIASAATMTVGIVIKIKSKNKIDKVLDIYNANP